ncbi:MAG: hypothetical protein K6B68_15845 [Eubacterium sp.]|nr:hypothetical protein [Eubacterium sp.]
MGRVKNMNESIYYAVDAIHTAISENKAVSFKCVIIKANDKVKAAEDSEKMLGEL